MLHSKNSLNLGICLFLTTRSALRRFKSRIFWSFKNVTKIPVTSHGTFLIAGCCFSKGSKNKPSLLSRIKNRKYISVNVCSQEVGNENHPFENETEPTANSTIMERNSYNEVSIEQYPENEQHSCERESKRLKRDQEFGTDSVVIHSQQSTNFTSLKESTSLENLFSEDNCSTTVIESDVSSKAKLQLDEAEEKSLAKDACTQQSKESKERKREIPNYFVAVKITDSQIHKTLKELQEHILAQDERLQPSMILLPTLHITLMVMHITDDNMHMKALKALQNVHDEYDRIMCQNPLCLDFKGLGHFQNRVLFAKLCMDDAYTRLCDLAECVKRHFAAVSIFSTDAKDQFTPHLTVAKLNFRKKTQRSIKKINPSLYSTYQNHQFGQQTIKSIQLLRMTGPKDEDGYYTGDELFFSAFHPDRQREAFNATLDTDQKKKEIKEKIHFLTKQVLRD